MKDCLKMHWIISSITQCRSHITVDEFDKERRHCQWRCIDISPLTKLQNIHCTLCRNLREAPSYLVSKLLGRNCFRLCFLQNMQPVATMQNIIQAHHMKSAKLQPAKCNQCLLQVLWGFTREAGSAHIVQNSERNLQDSLHFSSSSVRCQQEV